MEGDGDPLLVRKQKASCHSMSYRVISPFPYNCSQHPQPQREQTLALNAPWVIGASGFFV